MNVPISKNSNKKAILEIVKRLDNTSDLINCPELVLNTSDIRHITVFLKDSKKALDSLASRLYRASSTHGELLKGKSQGRCSTFSSTQKSPKRRSSLDSSGLFQKSQAQRSLSSKFKSRKKVALDKFGSRTTFFANTAPHSRDSYTPEIEETSLYPSTLTDSIPNTPSRSNCSSPVSLTRIRSENLSDYPDSYNSDDSPPPYLGKSNNNKDNLLEVVKTQLSTSYNAIHFQDLKEKEVVNKDFSKVKGITSVTKDMFKTYIRPYLRSFYLSDLNFIQAQSLDLETQITPSFEISKVTNKSPQQTLVEKLQLLAENNIIKAISPSIDTFETRLTTRLLCDLQKELNEFKDSHSIAEEEDLIVDENSCELPSEHLTKFYSINCFEARVITELARVNELPEVATQPPDNELVLELIRKQAQIKELNRYNNLKRERLRQVFSDHMAFQCYHHTLENIDVKLEKAFIKRQSFLKNRVQKQSSLRTLQAEIDELMENRRSFIEKVGDVLNPKKFLLPESSIHQNISIPQFIVPVVLDKGKTR